MTSYWPTCDATIFPRILTRARALETIEINRLLTKRQRRREAVSELVGIIIANLLALASLIVSILKHT